MMQSSEIGTRDSRRDRDDRDSRDREGSIDYRRREREESDERERQGANIFRRQDEREIYGTPINRSNKRREFDELGRAPGERILYNDRRNNSDIRREGIGRQLGPNLRDHEYDDRNPNRRGRYHPHDNSGQRDYFSHHRMYRYRDNFDDWDLRTIPRSRERKRPEHDRPRSDRDRERDRNASISRERQLSRVVPSRECTNQYIIHNMSGFEYPELETRQKFSFGFNKDFERDELQGIGPTYGNWRNRNRSTSPSPRSSVTSSSSFTRHRTRSPVPNKLDITKSEEPTNLSPTNIHSRSRPPSIKSAASPHRFEIEQSSVFMRLQNRDEKSSIDDNSSSCREKMQYTPEYKDEETNFSIESIQEIANSSQSNIGNEKGGWTGWHSLERREVDQSQRMEESKLISRSQVREINSKEQELLQSCSQNNDTSLEESDAQIEKFRNNITDSDGEPTINHIESNNVVISSTTAICDIVQNSTNENTNVGINTRIIEAPSLDGVPISQHIKTEELSNSGGERPKFQSLFEELEYVEGQIDIWEGLRDKKLEQIEKKRKFQADQKAIKRLKRDTEKISKLIKKDNSNNSQKVSPKRVSSVAHRKKKVEDTSTSAYRQKPKTIIKAQTSENSTINTKNKNICKNSLLDRWFNNQEYSDDSLDESKDNLFSKFQRKFQQGTKKERELREDYESRIRSKALDDDGSDSSIRGDELIKSVKGKNGERRNTKSKGKQRADSIPENSTTAGFAIRYPVRTTRSRRCSDYVTTDQEFAEILQKLGAEDQKQGQEQQRGESSRARVPPLQIDVSGQKASNFVDNSGRVFDPVEFYGHNTPLGSNWTEDEQNQFEELFKMTPKDFNKIADKMAHKTAGDCAIFYKHLKTARTKSGDVDEKKREIYNRLHDMKVKPKKRGQKRAVRGRNRSNFSSNQVPSPTRAIDTIEQSIVGGMESTEKLDVSLQISQLQRPKLEGSPSEITKETSINHILDQEVGQAALALTLMSRQFPIESTEKSSEQALPKAKTLTFNKTEGHAAQSYNDFRSRHIQTDGCQSTLSIGSLLNPSDEMDPSSFMSWFDSLEDEEQSLGNK